MVHWREAKASKVADGSFSLDDQGFDTAQTYVGHQCRQQQGGQPCPSRALGDSDSAQQANAVTEHLDTGAAEEACLVPADMKLDRLVIYSANG